MAGRRASVGGWVGALVMALCHGSDAATLVQSLAQRVGTAEVVVRGVATASLPHGEPDSTRAWTATRLQVSEVFKGVAAEGLWFERRGGMLGSRVQVFPDQPAIPVGADVLAFVGRDAEGRVVPLDGPHGIVRLDCLPSPDRDTLLAQVRACGSDGGADLSAASDSPVGPQALGFLLPAPSGAGSRFLAPDRGEPVPCLVDMELLPIGVSTSAALAAVQMALEAWQDASSAAFRIAGLADFGVSSADIATNDAAVRIQLHDKYNEIGGPDTLGVGGRWMSYDAGLLPDGGLGGRVGTNRFDRSDCGFVVIEHGKAAVQSVTGLAEVVCHELGHVLGIGHSSEDLEEEDETLRGALMFAYYHGAGRGATLGTWDRDGIAQAHPTNDTPPYGEWRGVDALTSSPQWTGDPDINRWEVRAYDRLGSGTSAWTILEATANYGTFSHVGNGTVAYAPTTLGSGDRLDPAGTAYYDRCHVVIDDGVNASPPVLLRVISLTYDISPRDKLSDPWQTTYGVGGATNDPDQDDFDNLSEWLNGTHPNSAGSRIVVSAFDGGALVFPSRAYDLYQVWGAASVDGAYEPLGNAVRPTTGVGTAQVDGATSDRLFLKLERIR